MAMAVMNIGQMRVGVLHFFMPMRVNMGLARRIVGSVGVLVMDIVPVAVGVGDRVVQVLVFVLLDQMHHDARSHQQCRDPELPVRRFMQQQDREQAADEGRGGEVGGGPRGAEVA